MFILHFCKPTYGDSIPYDSKNRRRYLYHWNHFGFGRSNSSYCIRLSNEVHVRRECGQVCSCDEYNFQSHILLLYGTWVPYPLVLCPFLSHLWTVRTNKHQLYDLGAKVATKISRICICANLLCWPTGYVYHTIYLSITSANAAILYNWLISCSFPLDLYSSLSWQVRTKNRRWISDEPITKGFLTYSSNKPPFDYGAKYFTRLAQLRDAWITIHRKNVQLRPSLAPKDLLRVVSIWCRTPSHEGAVCFLATKQNWRRWDGRRRNPDAKDWHQSLWYRPMRKDNLWLFWYNCFSLTGFSGDL